MRQRWAQWVAGFVSRFYSVKAISAPTCSSALWYFHSFRKMDVALQGIARIAECVLWRMDLLCRQNKPPQVWLPKHLQSEFYWEFLISLTWQLYIPHLNRESVFCGRQELCPMKTWHFNCLLQIKVVEFPTSPDLLLLTVKLLLLLIKLVNLTRSDLLRPIKCPIKARANSGLIEVKSLLEIIQCL